jgi:hypothetical protein
VDVILDGDFDTLTFRISGMNGNLAGRAIHVNLDALQILSVRVGGLHRFDFHFVAVPAFYLHGAIHVFEQKTSARRQWIAVFEGLAIRNRTETRRCKSGDARKQQNSAACSFEKPQSLRPEPSFPHFLVHGTPPRLHSHQLT